MKAAIIDLGANSFHLEIFDVKQKNIYSVVDRFSYLHTFGSFLANNEKISVASVGKMSDLVASLWKRAKKRVVKHVAVFGTSIFRVNPQSVELFDAIFKKTGLLVDVLSAREEARIIFEAVKHNHAVDKQSLIIDIGGGSSEFIIARGGKIRWMKSVPVGTASIIERSKIAKGKQDILSQYDGVISSLKRHTFSSCFGTCGFLRCIAFWLKKGTFRSRGAPVILTAADIHTMYRSLQCGSIKNGSQKERNITYAGSMVLTHIIKMINIRKILVSSVSTREGYLLKMIRKRLPLDLD
ncbi:MAG: hypothetical protein KKH94_08455 [Candidatus Omnitrophica bacterium]|nr:hypothetical protein [Candidatus Omnitrophota bacterium]